MQDWIRIFENAKNHALRSHKPQKITREGDERPVEDDGSNEQKGSQIVHKDPAIAKWNSFFKENAGTDEAEDLLLYTFPASLHETCKGEKVSLVYGRIFLTAINLHFWAHQLGGLGIRREKFKWTFIRSLQIRPETFHWSIELAIKEQKASVIFKSVALGGDPLIGRVLEKVHGNAQCANVK